MKLLYLICALSFSIFSNSQSEVIAGKYEKISDATNAYIQYTLELKNDGTFEFHSYHNIEANLERESNYYGRGTWTADGKVVTLNTSQTDFSEKYTLDFSGTKGRFITKSRRNKSDREIPTSIRFFKSEILQGWLLLKI